MNKPFLYSVFLLLPLSSAFAQQEATKPEPPKTKLESFAKQGETRLIEGFTELGTITGMVGRLDIQASEFINPIANTKSYGVVATLRVLNNSIISYIDPDEIDGILSGLEFLDKTNKSVTKLDNFNATFQTRGGLAFHVYARDNGNVNVLVYNGRYPSTSGNFRKTDIAQISALMVKAKAKLDSIK